MFGAIIRRVLAPAAILAVAWFAWTSTRDRATNATPIQMPPNTNAPAVTAGAPAFGISFPPVQNDEQRAFTLQHLQALGVDRVRFAEHWNEREPSPGEFVWGPIDARLAFFAEHGIHVMLTIESLVPDWACSSVRSERGCVPNDTEDFRRFVRALLERHGSRIAKIQYGNEWNSEYWFPGTAEQYAELATILADETHAIAPQVEVVLGGLSIGAVRALGACAYTLDQVIGPDGGLYSREQVRQYCAQDQYRAMEQRVTAVLSTASYDAVDIHLYDDAEHWASYLRRIREFTNVPVLVSEFGGPHPVAETYSDDYHAGRVSAYLSTLAGLDVTDAYYFKLVETPSASIGHPRSGLINEDLEPKPAYEVFQTFIREQ